MQQPEYLSRKGDWRELLRMLDCSLPVRPSLGRGTGHRVGTVAAATSLQARRDRVGDITRPALPTPSRRGSRRSRREP
jgi:hypothetical protein